MTLPVFLDARLSGNSGIGRYIDSLLAEFARHPEWGYRWSLAVNDARHCTGIGEHRVTDLKPFSPLWQLQAPFALPRDALFWTPHWNHPILTRSRRANVVTVHDVMPLRFPQLYSARDRRLFSLFVATAVRRGYRIITVSEFSKTEILALFPAARVDVMLNGVTPLPVAPDSPVATGPSGAAPYFLCVGNLKPHKNLPFAIRAFRLAKQRGWIPADMRLLIAGAVAGLRQADQALLSTSGRDTDVQLIEHPSDDALGRLYRDCAALVAPSLYEGFGLPILEAMHFGRPILCSDIPPFREIADTAVRYFDPADETACADAMRHTLAQPALPPDRYQDILARFTWARSAQAHHQLFNELLHSSPA